ncbi:PfkB family carbohydrate kinase [Mesorhizobium sp. BR1-1-16]|uniref:carbohydrate kinase family protein n=1 Tax=Mesorhizobium sp. BR1-1-16 TaxID=2876653 RepID=UPI001CCDD457|nr:PfkB family carbohydrate kinase [Mesorhizobium sp. BR1-1-16]MBZ9938569.1 PfkB family carbohydrate kinase [Mesorhizobium sp. BR1-1-16]
MMAGRDLIASAALIDTLLFADGRAEENVAGGAGLYALAGAALFSDGGLLVTGTGEDYVDAFGPWMARNGLSTDGLRLADPHTPRNLLRYIDERTRTETPMFGAAHFQRIEPRVSDIERVLDGARSLYVFRDTGAAFWDDLLAWRRPRPKIVLWEISLDACLPEELPRIVALLHHVDALSLNLEEAGHILGLDDEEAICARVAQWPAPSIFLRAGSRGSYAIERGAVHFVPSLAVEAVDVTGGGNAYSGAALVGLAEGAGCIGAAAFGTVAASIAISQLGLPEPSDPGLRSRARRDAAALALAITQEACT